MGIAHYSKIKKIETIEKKTTLRSLVADAEKRVASDQRGRS